MFFGDLDGTLLCPRSQLLLPRFFLLDSTPPLSPSFLFLRFVAPVCQEWPLNPFYWHSQWFPRPFFTFQFSPPLPFFWVLDQLKKKDWGKYFLLSSIWPGFLPRRTFWFAQTSKAINVKKITHKWKTFMIQMNEVWKHSSGLYGHIWGNGPLHGTL